MNCWDIWGLPTPNVLEDEQTWHHRQKQQRPFPIRTASDNDRQEVWQLHEQFNRQEQLRQELRRQEIMRDPTTRPVSPAGEYRPASPTKPKALDNTWFYRSTTATTHASAKQLHSSSLPPPYHQIYTPSLSPTSPGVPTNTATPPQTSAVACQPTDHRGITLSQDASLSSSSLAAELKGLFIEYRNLEKPVQISDMMVLYLELPRLVNAIFRVVGSQESHETYRRCLQMDLERAGVEVVVEPEVKLYYRGDSTVMVGTHKVDMVIRTKSKEKAVLQIKAQPDLTIVDMEELQFYMNGFDINRGYLINFPHDDGFPVAMTHTFHAQALLGQVDARIAERRSFLPPHSPARTGAQVVQLHRAALSPEEIELRKEKTLEEFALAKERQTGQRTLSHIVHDNRSAPTLATQQSSSIVISPEPRRRRYQLNSNNDDDSNIEDNDYLYPSFRPGRGKRQQGVRANVRSEPGTTVRPDVSRTSNWRSRGNNECRDDGRPGPIAPVARSIHGEIP